jgi:hypothetical protein
MLLVFLGSALRVEGICRNEYHNHQQTQFQTAIRLG